MRSILCLVFCVLCFCSCNQNNNQPPVLGTLDSAAIAADTTMQLGFESSYEFHKTLTVHEKLVYDVVGYGGSSSKGEYAILRRGADNKADTVTKGKREGIIADAFLADSNKNHREEIYIITQNPSQISDKKILRFEPEQR